MVLRNHPPTPNPLNPSSLTDRILFLLRGSVGLSSHHSHTPSPALLPVQRYFVVYVSRTHPRIADASCPFNLIEAHSADGRMSLPFSTHARATMYRSQELAAVNVGALDLDSRGYRLVLEVHQSIVSTCPL